MTTFSAQREEVLGLAADAATLTRERGAEAAATELEQAAADLRDGKLTIAVVGEFKRGKSTLLNALLEDHMFPEADVVATNMVTTATHGEEERIVVHVDEDGKGGTTRAEEIARDQIPDYVTEQGNPDNKRRARLLEIEVPSDKLRDGLMFVDTPGVGGLNSDHTAVTYGFVTSADVVLFVLDVFTTLSTEELEFVKTIGEHAHDVIFVVTKIDKSPDYMTVVENTREKAAATLSRSADEIAVVAVSSLAKLDYLESGDEEDLEASNFQELEDRVWTMLRERGGAIMLLRALGSLARTLDGQIAPLKAELEAYSEKTKEELDAAERDLSAAAKRMEELQKDQSSWRKTLRREERTTALEMEEMFRSGARALRRQRDALLDDARLMENPAKVTNLLERDVTLFAQGLTEELERRANATSEKLAAETGLELNPAAPDVPIAARAAAPSLEDVSSGDAGKSIYKTAQGLSMGRSSGMFIGGVIGTLMSGAAAGSVVPGPGTVIGAVVGALAGMGLGLRNNLKDIRESDRRKLRDAVAKQVNPWLDECVGQLDSRLKQAVAMAAQNIADAFDDMLRDEVEQVRESQAALAEGRKRTKDEAAARAKELREPLTRLEHIRHALDAQAKAALEPARDEPEPGAAPPAAEPVGVVPGRAVDEHVDGGACARADRRFEAAHELERLRTLLAEARAHLDEPMRVAIVGHIKAGKSTMLNALLGEELAPTGTEELTFNVNWLRHGKKAGMLVHFKDGRDPEERTLGELEELTARKEEARELLSAIRYVELRHPSEILRTFDLIDTPGLKSFFSEDSLNTLAFLGLTADDVESATREQSGEADALVCLFTRGLAGAEQSVVDEFQGPLLGEATPISALGVLTKVDMYWDPRDPDADPLDRARVVVRAIEEEPDADRVFYAVMPACGLVAFGSQTLTAEELDALEALGRMEPPLLAKRLKNAASFETRDYEDVPIPADMRRRLLRIRLGQWGIWLAAGLLREGASEEQVREELWRRSGVAELRDLVVSHFGHRALLIKAQTGLRKGLEEVRRARRGVNGEVASAASEVGGALEDLELSQPAFGEFALLRRYYRERDSLALRDGEGEELLRLTGEYGTSIGPRLGLGERATAAEMCRVAEERLAYWHERRDEFGADTDTMATARVMAGAYQRILYHAREARRHLELDP